jgi:hypothetical protein
MTHHVVHGGSPNQCVVLLRAVQLVRNGAKQAVAVALTELDSHSLAGKLADE